MEFTAHELLVFKINEKCKKSLMFSNANCLRKGHDIHVGTCTVNGLPDVDLTTSEMWMLIIHLYDPATTFNIYDIKKRYVI